MAAMRRALGTSTGRGVDANGLLGRFAAWVILSIANGGPGWYIIDNRLADATQPGIVISNMPAPAPNDGAKIIHVYFLTANASCIFFAPCYYWNTTTHTGYYWSRHQNPTLDSGQFNYWFMGGAEMMAIITKIGSAEPAACILDEFEGDNNLLKPETAGSTLAEDMYLEAGDTQNQISGYWNITGAANLVDANGRLHFRTVVSGANLQVNIYRDAAGSLLVGHTTSSNALGTRPITADASSGLGGSLNVDLISGTTSNTAINCRFYRVRVQSGHGANYEIGDGCYLTDFQDYTPRISYSIVTAISGDVLTLDYVRTGHQFKAGARFSPYSLRLCSFGYDRWRTTALSPSTSPPASNMLFGLPYFSRQGFEYDTAQQVTGSDPSIGQVGAEWPSTFASRANPNKRGKRLAPRPLLYEFYSFGPQFVTTGMTEGYGRPKNIRLTRGWGGQTMGETIQIGQIEFAPIAQSSTLAYLTRYSESAT